MSSPLAVRAAATAAGVGWVFGRPKSNRMAVPQNAPTPSANRTSTGGLVATISRRKKVTASVTAPARRQRPETNGPAATKSATIAASAVGEGNPADSAPDDSTSESSVPMPDTAARSNMTTPPTADASWVYPNNLHRRVTNGRTNVSARTSATTSCSTPDRIRTHVGVRNDIRSTRSCSTARIPSLVQRVAANASSVNTPNDDQPQHVRGRTLVPLDVLLAVGRRACWLSDPRALRSWSGGGHGLPSSATLRSPEVGSYDRGPLRRREFAGRADRHRTVTTSLAARRGGSDDPPLLCYERSPLVALLLALSSEVEVDPAEVGLVISTGCLAAEATHPHGLVVTGRARHRRGRRPVRRGPGSRSPAG